MREYRSPISLGKSEWIYTTRVEIALFAIGSMVKVAEQVRNSLKEQGYSCSLINARFAKPLDEDTLREITTQSHQLIVTMEENVAIWWLWRACHLISTMRCHAEIDIWNVAIPDEYIEHGNVAILYKEVGIDSETVTEGILSRIAPAEERNRTD